MKILEVKLGSEIYYKGVQLRRLLFFQEFENWEILINDIHEKNSVHLVAWENDTLIGTGRITFQENQAIISQMTVQPGMQKTGVGSKILNAIVQIAKKNNASSIKLSARETAIAFYKKHQFQPVGETYPSAKTGVIHQQMILEN